MNNRIGPVSKLLSLWREMFFVSSVCAPVLKLFYLWANPVVCHLLLNRSMISSNILQSHFTIMDKYSSFCCLILPFIDKYSSFCSLILPFIDKFSSFSCKEISSYLMCSDGIQTQDCKIQLTEATFLVFQIVWCRDSITTAFHRRNIWTKLLV